MKEKPTWFRGVIEGGKKEPQPKVEHREPEELPERFESQNPFEFFNGLQNGGEKLRFALDRVFERHALLLANIESSAVDVDFADAYKEKYKTDSDVASGLMEELRKLIDFEEVNDWTPEEIHQYVSENQLLRFLWKEARRREENHYKI